MSSGPFLIKRASSAEIDITDGVVSRIPLAAAVAAEWATILGVGAPGYTIVSDALWNAIPLHVVVPPPPPPPPVPVGPGRRPFSSTSMWNTPNTSTSWFDTPSLHTNSAGFRHWWVNPTSAIVWFGAATDPLWTFNMPTYIYAPCNRNRPAQTFQARGPANMMDGGDSDHSLVLVDIASGNYVEVWNANVNQAARTVTCFPGGPGWATGDFVNGPGGGTLGNNDGTRAANFSWAGGLITGRDFTAGKIDHALALALPADMLKSGGAVFRAPATCGDFGTGHTGPITMGSRIGIPAAGAKPAGLSSIGSMVFDALKTYGAFVGDYCGGAWPIFYSDKNTVSEARMHPLYAFWDFGGSSDMEKIGPLLRVADYQP